MTLQLNHRMLLFVMSDLKLKSNKFNHGSMASVTIQECVVFPVNMYHNVMM